MTEQTESAEDLAPWLRDWRLTDCEHAHDPCPLSNGLTCCSPCLRDRILASDWLAAREAAAEVRGAQAVLGGLGEWVTGDGGQVTCRPCLETVHA